MCMHTMIRCQAMMHILMQEWQVLSNESVHMSLQKQNCGVSKLFVNYYNGVTLLPMLCSKNVVLVKHFVGGYSKVYSHISFHYMNYFPALHS